MTINHQKIAENINLFSHVYILEQHENLRSHKYEAVVLHDVVLMSNVNTDNTRTRSPSLKQCEQKCSETAGCVGVSFFHQTKTDGQITSLSSRDDINNYWSADQSCVILGNENSKNIYHHLDISTQLGHSVLFIHDFTNYIQMRNVAVIGYDDVTPTEETYAFECLDQCVQSPSCTAVTSKDSRCFLYTTSNIKSLRTETNTDTRFYYQRVNL